MLWSCGIVLYYPFWLAVSQPLDCMIQLPGATLSFSSNSPSLMVANGCGLFVAAKLNAC
jgi:hypothetical protein